MLTIEIRDVNGQVLGVFRATPKKFSTGSVGFHATGKMVVNGKSHQCNFLLTEIGSKPKAK